jgi:hypothetical protein
MTPTASPPASCLLRVATGLEASFSAQHLVVEVLRWPDDTHRARITKSPGRNAPGLASEFRITPEQGAAFVASLWHILQTPEQGAQGRSTTRYHAEVTFAPDQHMAPVNTASTALPKALLEELAASPTTHALAASEAALRLSEGYHVWAHALLDATLAWIGELEARPRPCPSPDPTADTPDPAEG